MDSQKILTIIRPIGTTSVRYSEDGSINSNYIDLVGDGLPKEHYNEMSKQFDLVLKNLEGEKFTNAIFQKYISEIDVHSSKLISDIDAVNQFIIDSEINGTLSSKRQSGANELIIINKGCYNTLHRFRRELVDQ